MRENKKKLQALSKIGQSHSIDRGEHEIGHGYKGFTNYVYGNAGEARDRVKRGEGR